MGLERLCEDVIIVHILIIKFILRTSKTTEELPDYFDFAITGEDSELNKRVRRISAIVTILFVY